MCWGHLEDCMSVLRTMREVYILFIGLQHFSIPTPMATGRKFLSPEKDKTVRSLRAQIITWKIAERVKLQPVRQDIFLLQERWQEFDWPDLLGWKRNCWCQQCCSEAFSNPGMSHQLTKWPQQMHDFYFACILLGEPMPKAWRVFTSDDLLRLAHSDRLLLFLEGRVILLICRIYWPRIQRD